MILDACCGPKEMYRGLHKRFTDEEIVYIDIRKGHFDRSQWGQPQLVVEPTIQTDLKHLPFQDEVFTLILFDPPHGGFTMDTWMGIKYGGLTIPQFREMLAWANIEFARTLKPAGVLLAKIQEVDYRDNTLKGAFRNFKQLLNIRYKSQGSVRSEQLVTAWHIYIKKLAPTTLEPSYTLTQRFEAQEQLEQQRRLKLQKSSTLAAYL